MKKPYLVSMEQVLEEDGKRHVLCVIKRFQVIKYYKIMYCVTLISAAPKFPGPGFMLTSRCLHLFPALLLTVSSSFMTCWIAPVFAGAIWKSQLNYTPAQGKITLRRRVLRRTENELQSNISASMQPAGSETLSPYKREQSGFTKPLRANKFRSALQFNSFKHSKSVQRTRTLTV
ncbi:unnamed protein product [Ranitomeya imitator]|uniref:Uncharacterized protein n=1 Tax=Ranitomeya imitator TaxID=111125 RepID=A0ABN9LHF2_9NEOB|nr:unnamed protein product [Ranitomeya imitator]